MSRSLRLRGTVLALGLVGMLSPLHVHGQATSPHRGHAGIGVSVLQRGWSGTGWVQYARYGRVLGPLFQLEAGLTRLAHPRTDVSMIIPELGLHLATGRTTGVFAGIGTGAALRTGGEIASSVTGHAAAGTRVRLSARFMLQTEVRLRAHGSSGKRSVDLSVGLVRIFPR